MCISKIQYLDVIFFTDSTFFDNKLTYSTSERDELTQEKLTATKSSFAHLLTIIKQASAM